MRSIAVMNQKGGVGKTTTVVNLSAALCALGKRVLALDIDPQSNLTTWLLGPGSEELEGTVAELLQGALNLEDVVMSTGIEGLDLAPADLRLSGAERTLAGEIAAETILRKVIDRADLAPCEEDPGFDLYDFLIIDCPPSVGMLTVNALSAVKEIVIPVQAQALSLNGVANLRRVIGVIQSRLNPQLRISGILLSMTDGRTNLSREVEETTRRHFGDLVFETTIRENVRVAECPSHFLPLSDYAPSSPAVADYRKLAEEVLGREGQEKVPLQETA